MKKLILLFSVFILFSCVNKEEEIQNEIKTLKSELQTIQKEGAKLADENIATIEFRSRKQLAANDVNYPTPEEDKKIEENLKKMDSIGKKTDLILKKIDSLESLIKK
jgi:hypothetical protein